VDGGVFGEILAGKRAKGALFAVYKKSREILLTSRKKDNIVTSPWCCHPRSMTDAAARPGRADAGQGGQWMKLPIF
jgi:hypothetical protein